MVSILGAIASAVGKAVSDAYKKSKSSSGSSGSSSSSSGGNVKKTDGGYAYTDKYGYSHVVKDYDTAKKYASGGIYDYSGDYSHGYAKDSEGRRMAVPLPGAKNYGNYEAGTETPLMSRSSFDSLFPGALGSKVTSPPPTSLFPTATKQSTPASTSIASLIPSITAGIRTNIPSTTSNIFDQYGGRDAYISSQQNRYQNALSTGNADLINRLQADANRVGYSLMPAPVQSTPQAALEPVTAGVSAMNMPLYPVQQPDLPEIYTPRQFDPSRDYEVPKALREMEGVSWIPTNQAVNQFQQNEQQRYNASRDEYDRGYNQWQDQQNLYWQQYQEQQRQQENQSAIQREEAQRQQALEQLAYEQALQRWTVAGKVLSEADARILGVPVGTPTSDQSYRSAILALDQAKVAQAGSSGGGSGGLTPYQQSQQDQKNRTATAEYIAQIGSYENREQALSEFEKYKTVMELNGADTNMILSEINRIFPPTNSSVNENKTSNNNKDKFSISLNPSYDGPTGPVEMKWPWQK